MGRPALHDTDALLDAAGALGAARGPAHVTMAGVAQAAAAPSGSLYHRFPTRAALLGELWLRTVTRFQAGFLEALGDGPAIEACVGAARHVVRFSRDHEAEAKLLLRGPEDFAATEWPPPTAEGIAATGRALERALRRVAEELDDSPRRGGRLDRVTFATVDVPSAAVRRCLRSTSGGVPAEVEGMVEDAVRAILASG